MGGCSKHKTTHPAISLARKQLAMRSTVPTEPAGPAGAGARQGRKDRLVAATAVFIAAATTREKPSRSRNHLSGGSPAATRRPWSSGSPTRGCGYYFDAAEFLFSLTNNFKHEQTGDYAHDNTCSVYDCHPSGLTFGGGHHF